MRFWTSFWIIASILNNYHEINSNLEDSFDPVHGSVLSGPRICTNVLVHCWPRVRFNKYGCNDTDRYVKGN
jgi:hypothetical protein